MIDLRRRSFAVEIDSDGGFIVPEEVRRDLGWSPGKDLWLEVNEDEIILTTPERAMERARRRTGNLFESEQAGVDAFIAERQRTAGEDERSQDERGNLAA